MSPIKVLVAEDHPVVRIGIRCMLDRDPAIEVIGEASNGREALKLAAEQQPDVLVLDIEMPEINGVDVAQELSRLGVPVRILILSAHDDPEYIEVMLKIGVAGYIIKEDAIDEIVDAVKGIAQGEQGWVSRRVAVTMTSLVSGGSQNPCELTQRELAVLRGVVSGSTNSEIAVKLGISEKTVEKHMEKIFKKLNVSSRVQAAVAAVQEDLAS